VTAAAHLVFRDIYRFFFVLSSGGVVFGWCLLVRGPSEAGLKIEIASS
jgi:hypothetical protein